MSEDLIDWLRAQIDLDRQKAAAFSIGTWVRRGQREVYSLDGDPVAAGADRAEADFIADHDPARVLREVDSLRKILDLHREADDKHNDCNICFQPWPCGTLYAVAAIFSDRPGYREEWRPQ